MIAIHSQPDAFSPQDCAALLAQIAKAPVQDAGLVGHQRDHNMRRADVVWLDDIPGTGWVMDRIIDLVREVNTRVFDFDLREFAESPQVARYDAAREGHFDWHTDIGDGPVAGKRKLTIVVQLSEAGHYQGGALEVMRGSAVVEAPRDMGAATLFPGFLLHRVTPVTEGTRHSLTVWAHGPAFR
jgi:PKHD-type hydroxylase